MTVSVWISPQGNIQEGIAISSGLFEDISITKHKGDSTFSFPNESQKSSPVLSYYPAYLQHRGQHVRVLIQTVNIQPAELRCVYSSDCLKRHTETTLSFHLSWENNTLRYLKYMHLSKILSFLNSCPIQIFLFTTLFVLLLTSKILKIIHTFKFALNY